jgi:lysozyme
MHCSEIGIELIKHFEGLRLTAYLCIGGKPTIGFGSTFYPDGRKVNLGDIISEQQANELLMETLSQFERVVNELLDGIRVNQNQFDALVSFAFNLGTESLAQSTLLNKIKSNHNDTAIAIEFDKWVMAGGQRINGLVIRRRKEAELYFTVA